MSALTTKLILTAVFAVSMSAPVFAQQPNWSQQGDYYAPSKTIVQHATPQELNEFRGGDYYTPNNTVVEPATPRALNTFRDGDFYEPTAS